MLVDLFSYSEAFKERQLNCFFVSLKKFQEVLQFISAWFHFIHLIAFFSDSASDIEEVDIIPESHDPQPDSPAEDVVSVMLKRENSLRHSQRHAMRNGRCVYTPHAPSNLSEYRLFCTAFSSYPSEWHIGTQPPFICRTKTDDKCLVLVTKQLVVGLLSSGDITHLPCALAFTVLILLSHHIHSTVLSLFLFHHIANSSDFKCVSRETSYD